MLLARLAVSTSWQGKGLSSGLLEDAMLRTLQAAEIAGIRAFGVHAKDDAAKGFLRALRLRRAAERSVPSLPPAKDIRAALSGAGRPSPHASE
jgi:GNAT superfamily N-acetyltransferase